MEVGFDQAEALEKRLLLSSVARTGGTLRVYGDAGVGNVIEIAYASASKNSLNVTVNGQLTPISADNLKAVRIFGDNQNDTIIVDSTFATYNIATSIFGGAGDDRIRCGNERDYVEGDDGNDRISLGNGRNFGIGDAGDDIIDGGDQRDFISGGSGADLIHGGLDRDQLQGDNGDDIIFGGTGNPDDEDGSDLIFGGRGNDSIEGEAGRDVMLGGDGNDTIIGGSDQDEIFGMAGDDVLDGGNSGDTIWGGDGNDSITGTGHHGASHQGEFKGIAKFIRAIEPNVV